MLTDGTCLDFLAPAPSTGFVRPSQSPRLADRRCLFALCCLLPLLHTARRWRLRDILRVRRHRRRLVLLLLLHFEGRRDGRVLSDGHVGVWGQYVCHGKHPARRRRRRGDDKEEDAGARWRLRACGCDNRPLVFAVVVPCLFPVALDLQLILFCRRALMQA